jgi:hypothetical protein
MASAIVTIPVLVLAIGLATPADAAPQAPPRNNQFDFWLGSWNLTWQGGTGTNTITNDYDGRVVTEHFAADTGSTLKGTSMSVFNAGTDKWQQTWVDNQGSYLDFTGGLEGDRMIMSRRASVKGKDIVQRMVWYNISADALDWNWERSDDDGKTWTTVWQIHYTRAQ